MNSFLSIFLLICVVAFLVFQVVGIVNDIKNKRRVKNNKSGVNPDNNDKGVK